MNGFSVKLFEVAKRLRDVVPHNIVLLNVCQTILARIDPVLLDPGKDRTGANKEKEE
jgi:hypothetical protein